MKKIASHSRIWHAAGLLVVDCLVFGLINPHTTPSFMLAAGFLLLAANIYYLLLNCLRLGKWYGLGSGVHQRRFARTVAGVLSGLIALQSIGELGMRDIVLALPLVLIAYIYMSYGKSAGQAVEN